MSAFFWHTPPAVAERRRSRQPALPVVPEDEVVESPLLCCSESPAALDAFSSVTLLATLTSTYAGFSAQPSNLLVCSVPSLAAIPLSLAAHFVASVCLRCVLLASEKMNKSHEFSTMSCGQEVNKSSSSIGLTEKALWFLPELINVGCIHLLILRQPHFAWLFLLASTFLLLILSFSISVRNVVWLDCASGPSQGLLPLAIDNSNYRDQDTRDQLNDDNGAQV